MKKKKEKVSQSQDRKEGKERKKGRKVAEHQCYAKTGDTWKMSRTVVKNEQKDDESILAVKQVKEKEFFASTTESQHKVEGGACRHIALLNRLCVFTVIPISKNTTYRCVKKHMKQS